MSKSVVILAATASLLIGVTVYYLVASKKKKKVVLYFPFLKLFFYFLKNFLRRVTECLKALTCFEFLSKWLSNQSFVGKQLKMLFYNEAINFLLSSSDIYRENLFHIKI